MPKSTNDSTEKKINNIVKEIKNTSTKKSTTKSSTKKSSTSETKLKTDKKSKISDTNKSTTNSKVKTAKRSSNIKSSKKVATASTAKTRTKKSSKKEEALTNLEYYDLPYRYNQTIVKILSQTPNTLFIYWDISDYDRKNLEETFGKDFFSNTKPVLIVHNKTKNYSFEVEINDFANSWYLHINDTDCKYDIELGRRFFEINNSSNENVINTYKNNNYIYISSSNELITPNNHILLNPNNHSVQFKNIKNNTYFSKQVTNINLYKEIYSKEIYSEEILNNIHLNPSSSFMKM